MGALSTQRSELAAAISTEASNAAVELNDLNSEISTFDAALEGDIAADAMSVDARSKTNAEAISNMPIAIAAVSSNVVAHEAAQEAAGDALEAKIGASLSGAESVRSMPACLPACRVLSFRPIVLACLLACLLASDLACLLVVGGRAVGVGQPGHVRHGQHAGGCLPHQQCSCQWGRIGRGLAQLAVLEGASGCY